MNDITMKVVIFLPASFVCLLAITIGMREEILIDSITTYYPLMIAMTLGSMLAGSTPLGGGVVAFPITVLVLNFTSYQGRDFSLLIQTVGMIASSFLILTKMKGLLKGEGFLITAFCFFNCVGLVIGFGIEPYLSPFEVDIFYTTSVACFAIILASLGSPLESEHAKAELELTDGESIASDSVDVIIGQSSDEKVYPTGLRSRIKSIFTKADPTLFIDPSKTDRFQNDLIWLGLIFSGIGGGILTSQIGSGADMAWYAYGVMLNYITPFDPSSALANSSRSIPVPTPRFSENSLSAISVIVMACASVNGTILRITARKESEMQIDRSVYEAFLACSFIAVFGAPLGSTFLTPSHQRKLKFLFNLFAFIQLILFGAIRIKGHPSAWIFIIVCLTISTAISLTRRIRRQ